MNKIFCWSKFVEESEIVFLTHNRIKHITFDNLCVMFSLYGGPFGIKVFKLNGTPRSDYESFVKATLENNPQRVLSIVRAIEEGLSGYQHPVATSYLEEKLLNLAFIKGKKLQEEANQMSNFKDDDLDDLSD